ncbi:hypothetical protein ACH9EU_13620 [Kocuria sp. M1R5S2]|uniref:hypothetical protein n=1 Tax=Kocuria rhizosphaerae TaxID=3376285 RepID=UPI0037A6DE80
MTTHPEHPGPADRGAVPDGERTAWLVPTAVLGGIGALVLLTAGGATAAASLSIEQHRLETTVTEPVTAVEVDGRSAVVEVVTADVEHVLVEAVHAGFRLEDVPEPQVENGRLTLAAPPSGSWFGTGSWIGPRGGMQVRVTVPAEDEPVDLRLSGRAGTLSAEGDFRDVRLETEAGVVEVQGSARSLWASSEVGAVSLDGVRVREDLDVHTEVGATEVRLTGDAPRRVSVTTRAGAIEAEVQDAAWWTPVVAGADERGTGRLTAAAVCAGAPEDRPCLFVRSAVGAAEVAYAARP